MKSVTRPKHVAVARTFTSNDPVWATALGQATAAVLALDSWKRPTSAAPSSEPLADRARKLGFRIVPNSRRIPGVSVFLADQEVHGFEKMRLLKLAGFFDASSEQRRTLIVEAPVTPPSNREGSS